MTPEARSKGDHYGLTLPQAAYLEELLARLGSSRQGLSSSEAEARLERFGFNELRAIGPWNKIWTIIRFAANPVILILLAAALASAMLREVVDALIICGMVTLSLGLNFWQSFRSQRAADRLKEKVAPTATVLRDGIWRELSRPQLVPGDIVRISAGDLVPADVRLLESSNLHVQQAALTGESFPTEKFATSSRLTVLGPDSPSLLFLGTSIVSGGATAVVFATGRNTSFGDIVVRLSERPEETEFERGTRQFGVLILKTVFFLVLFVLIVNVSAGRDAFQALLFSIALAVGLAPENLPMITTVTLAQGAVHMAREKVIVKHLSAIQNLGSIDILCSDKTGTLTTGTMSLDATLDPQGRPSSRALELAQLNSEFESGIKSPFDIAILDQPSRQKILGAEKTDELPFDFDRRRISVVVSQTGNSTLITKGAPESVLDVCTELERDGRVQSIGNGSRRRLISLFQDLSCRGLRVLAVAYRSVSKPTGFTTSDERDLIFTGFVTFSDHMLDKVRESIEALKRDGIRVKILTGDNEFTTRHICSQAGIRMSKIALGREIEHLDEIALGRVAESTDVFARVSPSQKHRVIRALRVRGHVVGFLGDGINDAPSLHGADVGISVAGAVDIAREASDILLLERRLEVLHAGIVAGRKSFGNVFKYILMGTSSNFGNMLSMAAASIFLPFLPMLPVQILLNNFLYDLAQITIPTDKVDPFYVKVPQRWNVKLIRNFMLAIGPISSIYDFLTFFVLLHVFRFGESLFHTGWFVESLATQTFVLFVIRTVGRPWSNRPSASLTVTTLAVVVIGAILPLTPLAKTLDFHTLPAIFYLFLLIVVGTYLVLVELAKHRIMRQLFKLRA